MAKRHNVTIRYKSGNWVDVSVEKISVTKHTHTGEITEFTWTAMKPRPMYLGLDQIESVFIHD